MLTALYNLLIMPIQMIVEMTYIIMSRFLGNKGLAIIAVSLVIQTLVLPLYKRADALQDEEREKQEKMSRWVNHIKTTFKGDERFMMLSTYYRQQNYKTVYALKSSFSILLQIPFFMAAYNYLSHLQELKGVSFLFINDLGRPDALFSICGFTINILPILMTLVNIISGMIYTKGLPFRSKLQVYGLAAVFLVLLYTSPAGLVLYWTMNNVYSLLKNIFMKVLKHPCEVLGAVAAICGVALLTYVSKFVVLSKLKALFIIGVVIMCQIPWLMRLLKKKMGISTNRVKAGIAGLSISKGLFFWEMIFMTVLMGVLIPVSVISSSPSEFVINDTNPMRLVINNLSVYAGIFLIWCTVFYMLMTENVRKAFSVVMTAVLGVALFDYMVYSGGLGVMNELLVYEKMPIYTPMKKLINLLLIIVVGLVCMGITYKWSKLGRSIVQILTICMLAICVINGNNINTQMKNYYKNRQNAQEHNQERKLFSLSTGGKNVAIIMIDRAMSGYIPYIFDEYPDIREAYEDFTYYPNAMSYGAHTNYAAPALYGGYEYSPVAMDKRDKELLVDKHDEALKVLPVLFAENGYNSTVCDPPYAGYQWDSDLSIYDGYKNISAYITERAYMYKSEELNTVNVQKVQRSNFLYYGFAKTMPLALQNVFYNNGSYFKSGQALEIGVSENFLKWYTALISINEMTQIIEDDSNNFLFFQNSTAHDVTLLSYPECIPKKDLDYEEELAKQPKRVLNNVELRIDEQSDLEHYECNVAALRIVGEWIQMLKETGVYDNTRIIVVSDHGYNLGQFDNMKLDNGIDAQAYNPLLLVKDFDAHGFEVSQDFMVTADVPTLATQNVIDNPVNPFTGKPINSEAKYNEPQILTTGSVYKISENNGYTFDVGDGEWYQVKDNIFDVENWTKIEK